MKLTMNDLRKTIREALDSGLSLPSVINWRSRPAGSKQYYGSVDRSGEEVELTDMSGGDDMGPLWRAKLHGMPLVVMGADPQEALVAAAEKLSRYYANLARKLQSND